MAYTSEELAARLAALRKARDSGVLIVRHGDTSTQFRSLAELNAIIAELEGATPTDGESTRRSRISYIIQNSKGL